LSVKKSEVETALVNAWTGFKKDDLSEAESWASEAFQLLASVREDGSYADDCPPVPRLKFRDWWIMNPRRWFSKNVKPTTTVRKTMKKLIGVLLLSAVVGAGANYIDPLVQGPTSVDRGQFSAVSQCDTCDAIRLNDVDICADCGATDAVERIAAPLTHKRLGFFMRVDDGWQFKDGSTLFETEGEYVVPELVIKTRRM